MREKLVLFCLVIVIFGILTPNVNAQTSTSTNSAASRLKQQRMELKQSIKDTVQAKREEAKQIMKTRREEFSVKLQTIKDEKKKTMVERIDAKLSEINTKHTDRFTEVLGKLQEHLDKISQSVTEKKVLEDIKTAQAAIDEAKTAVENQAAKTYVIQITNETALRLNVGTTTSQLRKDLMSTHKLVVDAKQAVQALRKDNVMMKKEATSSANL